MPERELRYQHGPLHSHVVSVVPIRLGRQMDPDTLRIGLQGHSMDNQPVLRVLPRRSCHAVSWWSRIYFVSSLDHSPHCGIHNGHFNLHIC